MKNYFYKINKKYIENFSNKVMARFRNEDIRSNSAFIKSLFREINELFKFIGGKISSKDDIPKETEYPDSEKHNTLISNIGYDLEKIYTAQKLVEDDVNNLLNFNSVQRTKTFENLTSVQQQVYSIYIKNKKQITGEVTLPVGNPFTSFDNQSSESNGVFIDESRGVLTLQSTSSLTKPVDTQNVNVYFTGAIPDEPIFPSKNSLSIGSHWKIPGKPDAHFIDSSNLSQVSQYKQLMIDDPNNNLGVGHCEFESVKTEIKGANPYFNFKSTYRIADNVGSSVSFVQMISSSRSITPDEYALKNYIGSMFNKDMELIYLDVNNSLQGKYVKQFSVPSINLGMNPQYKIVIPFKQDAIITNEIQVDFEPDDLGYFPKIIWNKSFVYSNQNGTEQAYTLVTPADPNKISDDGVYKFLLNGQFVKPSRLELIVEYGSDSLHWIPIPFNMSHYVYSTHKTYFLDAIGGGKIALILGKSYDVFVDTEANEEMEKNRALNVLLARGK